MATPIISDRKLTMVFEFRQFLEAETTEFISSGSSVKWPKMFYISSRKTSRRPSVGMRSKMSSYRTLEVLAFIDNEGIIPLLVVGHALLEFGLFDSQNPRQTSLVLPPIGVVGDHLLAKEWNVVTSIPSLRSNS